MEIRHARRANTSFLSPEGVRNHNLAREGRPTKVGCVDYCFGAKSNAFTTMLFG